MEECCAVCAEPLEWLAYGPCGHREVCSTCTSRLRFILNDKNCCICKQECPSVVITKALGDYTNAVGDFSTLPAPANEGKVGNYWYYLDTQAYFDDEQHYKMIKAMCRLSCSVCDNTCGAQEPRKELPKRDREFKHIDQLRKHLFHAHKLSMCTLCLEGRKVFICEQKLYTRSQLDRHLSRGDSEVDGSEIERGGFMGHPICDFCRKRFYGDNELYMHMSRDHYTCHICQRRHPEHFEYYQNYSDLEAHFSQEHFLCENDDCMAKKFVVFASEAELKRHNAIEHAGNMSRSQRNAALQIPVSFQYRRSGSERESQRVARGQGRNMNSRLSSANPASSEMLDIQNAIHESMLTATAEDFNSGQSSDPLPSLLSSDMVANSSTSNVSTDPPRYLTAVSRRALNSPLEESAFPPLPGASETAPPRYPTAVSRRALNSPLEESSFPPLPVASGNASHKSRNKGKRSVKSMAALVRGGQGNIRVLNAAESRQNLGPGQLSSLYPVNSSSNQTNGSRNMNYSSRPAVVNAQEPVPSPDEFPPMAAIVRGGQGNTRVLNAAESRNSFGQGQLSSLYAVNSSSNQTNGNRNMNYSSRPTVVNAQEPVLNANEFPPILGRHHVSAASATENQGQASNAPLLSIEEVRAANKELIESIQSGLGGNEQQFAAFKDVSARFRNGDIGARKYYSHISKLGLSHLVPRLARLCPDQDKGRKLLEAHEAGIKKNSQLAVNQIINQTGGISIGSGSVDNHRKGKTVDVGSSKDVTSSSNADSGCSLGKPSEEVEVLSKDGYRTAPPRYPTAVSRRAFNSPLEESAFPSLPLASRNASHKSRNKGKRSVKSMSALVRGGEGNIRVLNAAESRQNLGPGQLSSLYPVNSSSNQTNGSRNMNYSSRPTVAAVVRGGQGKGRKLLEAHEAGIKKNSQLAVNQIINQTGGISSRSGSVDNHRKGKAVDVGSSKDVTSISNADSGRSLGKPSEEVEVLSKDGYRTAKGKAKPRETPVLNGMSGTSGSSSEEPADHCQRPLPLSDSLNAYHGEKWTCNACSLLNKQDSLLCLVCGTERPDGRFMKEASYGRKGKQKKKASKAQ